MTFVYLAIALFGIVATWSLLRGAPYVPSDKVSIASMLAFVEAGEGKLIADLGSGDGRIVLALARSGAVAHGYEFNPILARISRLRVRHAKLADRAFIHEKNFWNEDFSKFSGVTVFGAPHIMAELGEKLRRELAPGTPIASHVFRFPDWQHEARSPEGVYLYRI